MRRIERRLQQLDSKEARSSHHRSCDGTDDKWYKKPVGIITLAVIGGLLLAFIKYLLGI